MRGCGILPRAIGSSSAGSGQMKPPEKRGAPNSCTESPFGHNYKRAFSFRCFFFFSFVTRRQGKENTLVGHVVRFPGDPLLRGRIGGRINCVLALI